MGFGEEEALGVELELEEALRVMWDPIGGLERRVFEVVKWRFEGNESGGGFWEGLEVVESEEVLLRWRIGVIDLIDRAESILGGGIYSLSFFWWRF